MTASAVLVPAAPSIGPGLKPNDRSLVWTSWISLRCRGAWLVVASTAGGTGAGGSSFGSLFGPWLLVGSTEGMATPGGGDGGGDDCAVATVSTAGTCPVLAADGHKSSIRERLATPEPRTAPSAKPSINLRRRLRARSYAFRASRQAAVATSGSTALCRAPRSASCRDSPASLCLVTSSSTSPALSAAGRCFRACRRLPVAAAAHLVPARILWMEESRSTSR